MGIAMLAVIGLIFGSFVNALVWRLHERGKQTTWAKKTGVRPLSQEELSILRGRSMCPNCHHILAARDLVPVLSWLFLKGRCRYCRKPIAWQYPLVELVTAVIFVALYVAHRSLGVYSWIILALWLAAAVIMVALAVYDIRWRLLPNRLVYSLVGVACLIVVVQWLESRTLSTLWLPVFAAALLYGLFRGLYEVSKGAWLGYGDVRLAMALGLLAATPLRAFMLLFFASLVGTVAALPGLFRKQLKLTAQIPFGPYLILGLLIVQLWGTALLSIYRRIIGY